MQHYIANAICSVRFVTDAARPHRPTLRPGPLFTSAVYGTPQWCLLRSAMRNGCREGEIKTMGQGVPWAGDVCRGLGRDLGLCGAPPFKFYFQATRSESALLANRPSRSEPRLVQSWAH
jgi:hypothetical protein